MSHQTTPLRSKDRTSSLTSGLVLIAFLAISFAVAGFGTVSTLSNVDGWYATAEKAPWSPPNVLFGPVWTVLYTLMSVAAWLVWRRRDERGAGRALALYVAQLVVNCLWTPIFFGAYPLIGPSALWIGLVVIVALDVLVFLTLVAFARHSRPAAALLVPYLAWVLFAATLNAAVAVLNG
ncbi:TspO/MBR family protein [Rathayibacter iranicus]|uniref:Tryptophan-rich sensory protein n=2 Tax=Rathayibacter iranicus TaxID=59737 RepID=A0AAD1AFD0_9MICO|nr:TspO/MBR family protein [Rathayibacter iranicus]AZZ57362.1 tryptophan-rich sensory protein [Rathayibacter iranicus]MWV31083.1 tryptophan-rich sensory protein [Rathayibacter iranicus NCPPB 2253 = VKM Ac-1602]PPI47878.1 tryptophan-rich sensory protein [Rathayibacter iranicus]PPI61139.1 tryptophan-rich sensory protein [Rathayibacter iranicus]PPI72994.1 tryptophan-rich sensory protein [Rathayibacter iranicus]